MKKLIFIALLLLLSSCFSDFDVTVEYRIDPLLQPYVDKFYQEAAQRHIELQHYDLIVSLSNIDEFGLTVGTSVRINDKFFYNYDEYSMEIEAVVFHELGHALLHKDHMDKQPGIMNTTVCIDCYIDDEFLRTQYLDKLFN